ncbi:hypothetical protein [Terrisporobacter othiniensis]|uniref:hypothetical protein n=1 Tax=Terrisporobacter othiniensis TaxID=1577792 RepID=UPI00126A4264|nr:hypothetical protein [Terrisporobacter othiniensis]
MTISNKTIQGDVYIGPESVVTFNNVTVNGDIYVLGALKANSINAKLLKEEKCILDLHLHIIMEQLYCQEVIQLTI